MNSHEQWQVPLPSRGAWHPYPPTQTRGNRSPQQTLQNKEHVTQIVTNIASINLYYIAYAFKWVCYVWQYYHLLGQGTPCS